MLITQLGGIEHQTMALLEEAVHLTTKALRQAGINSTTTARIQRLAKVYFGPSRAKNRQREVRQFLAERGHGLETLDLMERYVARLRGKGKKRAWELRRRLGEKDISNHALLRREARVLLGEINPREPSALNTQRTMKITHHPRSTDATLHLRARSHEIKSLETAAREKARREDLTPAEAMMQMMQEGGGGDMELVTKVLVPLDEHTRLLRGDTKDVLLATTAGSIMTGQEYLSARLSERYEYVLLSNVDGPISVSTAQCHPVLTRAKLVECADTVSEATRQKVQERFASTKDRMLVESVHVVCAAENCCVAADRCQMNHNIAYKHGGLTILPNMTLLCPFHNGAAGDRTAYITIRGIGHRIMPGEDPVPNHHPIACHGGMYKLFGLSRAWRRPLRSR